MTSSDTAFSGMARRLRVNAPSKEVLNFRKIVWAYYKKHSRHDLPWRPTSLKLRKGKENDFVYKILVSEVMLQQTQVERVIPFYKKFIRKFGSAKKLAAAPLSDVLKEWQGLGYNRRAKMLQKAAKEFPRFDLVTRSNLVEVLEKLSGVGPYTARAVAAFAFNQDVVFVETNIRTAVIHHFFSDKEKVSDVEIEAVLERVLPKGLPAGRQGRAREWYGALMDYGSSLKRSGISHNAKSKTYVKQSKFAGSLREARGAILRELAREPVSPVRLVGLLGSERRAQMRTALRALFAEGLIEKDGANYKLAE